MSGRQAGRQAGRKEGRKKGGRKVILVLTVGRSSLGEVTGYST